MSMQDRVMGSALEGDVNPNADRLLVEQMTGPRVTVDPGPLRCCYCCPCSGPKFQCGHEMDHSKMMEGMISALIGLNKGA